jgi:hypothetical protein
MCERPRARDFPDEKEEGRLPLVLFALFSSVSAAYKVVHKARPFLEGVDTKTRENNHQLALAYIRWELPPVDISD